MQNRGHVKGVKGANGFIIHNKQMMVSLLCACEGVKGASN